MTPDRAILERLIAAVHHDIAVKGEPPTLTLERAMEAAERHLAEVPA